MRLTSEAERYCASKQVARTVVFSANRFVRLISDISIHEITHNELERFADLARRKGFSASTIHGTIKDLRTLARSLGLNLTAPVVKIPDPAPEPTSHEDIEAIWPHLSAWSRQHVAMTFHCCFRLADVIRLQLAGVSAEVTTIRRQAHKTGRNHAFPVPGWMRQWLGPVSLPFSRESDHSQVIVRAELERASLHVGVPHIYPRNLRQAGICAWGSANGMAGAIAHGSGLTGVMKHYINPLGILESAMARMRIPKCFGSLGSADSEATLLSNFRRLDPAAQNLISGTAERLAVG